MYKDNILLVRYSNGEDSYNEWYRIVNDDDDFIKFIRDVNKLNEEYKYVNIYSLNERFDLEIFSSSVNYKDMACF